MILGTSRPHWRSFVSRSARSLLRQMRFSQPPLRMPAIMEAWFFSSEKMMQPGSSFCSVASVVSLATIGRGEQQRRFLAVQVGQLVLQLDVVVGGAGDVARAARAGAGKVERRVHGGEHGRVLAHAEVVVGAPHGDGPGAVRREVLRGREAAAVAPDVGEHPVAALRLQREQCLAERLRIIHQVSPHAPWEIKPIDPPLWLSMCAAGSPPPP